MLTELSRLPCRVIATTPRNARAVAPEELKQDAERAGLRAEVVTDVTLAVDVAIRETSPSDLVCVTGSHYVVGEARSSLAGTPG